MRIVTTFLSSMMTMALIASLGFTPSTAQSAPSADVFFDFKAQSTCKGCLSFSDFSGPADFPLVDGQMATKIRFHYSRYGFYYVDQDSPYVEVPLDAGLNIIPFTIGGLSQGSGYYIRIALLTDRNEVLWFTPEDKCNGNRHFVETKDE